MSGRACVSNEEGNENVRAWQIRKLREAGLDPYMRATWDQAQALLREKQERDRAQVEAAVSKRAQETLPAINLDVPISPPTSPALIKTRGGKAAGACPHCGKVFMQALHFHVKRCPERLKLEAAV
jgi:hypothetical protein